jgi:hypothetical protein
MKTTATATITGQARIIKTAGGDRSLIYAQVANGDKHAIYRAAGDPEITGLKDGQEVEISIGAKGHADLVTRPQMGFEIAPPTPKPATGGHSAEILDYIDRLGKLYKGCYKTAVQNLEGTELAPPEVKDVATSIFIQTVRHFHI